MKGATHVALRWLLLTAITTLLAPTATAGSGEAALLRVSESKPAPKNDYYVLGGSFKTQEEAKERVDELFAGEWHAMKDEKCPRFQKGFWVAAAGPFSSAQATGFAIMTANLGTEVTVKKCH